MERIPSMSPMVPPNAAVTAEPERRADGNLSEDSVAKATREAPGVTAAGGRRREWLPAFGAFSWQRRRERL